MTFIVEMKRRKVLRAAFVYLVMFWLLLQITDVVGSILDLPAWVAKLIFFLLLGGLPVALILSWEFDLTSLGIYREKPQVQPGGNYIPGKGNNNNKGTGVVLSTAAIWILFIGTGLSVGAAAVIHLHDVRALERQFDIVAQEIAHELGHHLVADSEVLRTLGALFVENREPDMRTFQYISEVVISDHEEIRAIEWVPRVADVDRESFVADMAEYYPGFTIKAFDRSGKEIPAKKREIYFPVTYTVPKVGNEAAIGYDLLSNPARAKAINQSMLSGTTWQTKAIELVQADVTGFLMFSPVFAEDEVPVSQTARFESLRGFTLAVIDVRKLVTNAILTSPAATDFIGEITVFDAEVDSDVPLVRIDTSKGTDLSGVIRTEAAIDAGFGLICNVKLRPTRAMMASLYSSDHYIIGGVGILIAIVCALIVNTISAVREMPIDPPRLGKTGEDQDWVPSKWQTQ